MRFSLFLFFLFFVFLVSASDADFDQISKTCNICGASFGWHTLCTKCGHVMCDYLEPACKFCAGTDASYSGTFDPSHIGGDPNPEDNPMIKSQNSQDGVTVTTYNDGSISISGSDGGSSSYDLLGGSDLTVSFYENGSKVVRGTDSSGNSFCFTVLPDGTSFDGTNAYYLDSRELGTNTLNVPSDGGDSDNPFFGDGNEPFTPPDNPDNPGDIPDPEPDPDPDPDNPDNPGDNPDPDPDPDNPDNPGDNPDPDNPDNPGDNPSTGLSDVRVTNWPKTKLSSLPKRPEQAKSLNSDKKHFLKSVSEKLLPDLPSVSGDNDFSIPVKFDVSGFGVNWGDLSFTIGGFRSALGGCLLGPMACCRAISALVFVCIFSLAVVRAFRQW